MVTHLPPTGFQNRNLDKLRKTKPRQTFQNVTFSASLSLHLEEIKNCKCKVSHRISLIKWKESL